MGSKNLGLALAAPICACESQPSNHEESTCISR
jgi:hypothetical protein